MRFRFSHTHRQSQLVQESLAHEDAPRAVGRDRGVDRVRVSQRSDLSPRRRGACHAPGDYTAEPRPLPPDPGLEDEILERRPRLEEMLERRPLPGGVRACARVEAEV